MNMALYIEALTVEERFDLNSAMQNTVLKKVLMQQKASLEKQLLNLTFTPESSMEAFITHYAVEQARLSDINKFIDLTDAMSKEFEVFNLT